MNATDGSGPRAVSSFARRAAVVLLIVGATAGGFVVGGGADAAHDPSSATSTAPSRAGATPSVSTSPAEASSVSVPSTCAAAYTTELVEREGSGYLVADSTSTLVEEMADADMAAAFAELVGLRCAWSYVQGGDIDMASGIVEVPAARMTDVAAQLRASDAACVIVRGGLMCRTGGPDGPDDSTFVGEVHMLRDGIWAVHVGHWGVSEFAASMNEALFGAVEVNVPSS
jgi:hypothetical protein